MANYNDEVAYPVTAPEMTDTTLGTDKSAAGNPQVTFLWSAVFNSASAASQNVQTAQRANVNGADPVESVSSAGVLNLRGLESQSGNLTVSVDGARDTINFEPVFGTSAGTIAEGDAPPAVQANLDSHTGTLDIHRQLNDGATTATNLWSASKINTDITAHTGQADIHRQLNDAATTTTNLWSASKILAEIAANAVTESQATVTWTGDHEFQKPIKISDGASLEATIGIDQVNNAIRIEVPAGSGITQVFINKIGGDAALLVDGAVTNEAGSIPGDT